MEVDEVYMNENRKGAGKKMSFYGNNGFNISNSSYGDNLEDQNLQRILELSKFDK